MRAPLARDVILAAGSQLIQTKLFLTNTLDPTVRIRADRHVIHEAFRLIDSLVLLHDRTIGLWSAPCRTNLSSAPISTSFGEPSFDSP